MARVFDLEKAIRAWRRPYEISPAFLDEDVDELESSLRDRVDAFRSDGLPEEEAFRAAVGRMGGLGEADLEYRKVYWGKLKRESRLGAELVWRLTMLRNYVTVALRTFLRQKGYAFINILGLAIGLASFIVIGLYVQDERSYDRFHPSAERLYRVVDFRKVEGIGEESSSAPLPLAEALLADYPGQIEAAVRFFDFQAPTLSLAHERPAGDLLLFNESKVYFVDAAFFTVFNFPLAAGDPETALADPNTIVLTPSMARKYFGDGDPMGQTLRFEDQHDLLVTGVLAEDPVQTHLDFEFLVSFRTLDNPQVLDPRLRNHWIWNPSWTYVRLSEAASAAQMEAQFPDFVVRHFPESRHDRVRLYLQPITDIHLTSKLDYEMGPNSDRAYVFVFGTIAVLVLLISCFNFVNLATARSAGRAKEIGMRKVLGAHRAQLVRQILVESGLTGLAAVPLAVPMIWLMLPAINAFSGKSLGLNLLERPESFAMLALFALAVGLAAGLYPALYISQLRSLGAVGVAVRGARRGQSRLRQVLVVTQFSLSVVLIIGTVIALQQMSYLLSRGPGFEPEEVVLLPALRSPAAAGYDAFRSRLLDHPDVLAVTTVEDVPGMHHQTGGYSVPGHEEDMQFARLIVHDDFAATLGVEMAAGRDFTAAHSTDHDDAAVVNEALVRWAGWASNDDAIGRTIDGQMIVGVMRDFNFVSLHRPIEPFVLERIGPDADDYNFSIRYIAVRLNTENLEDALAFLEDEWSGVSPRWPFEVLFLNELLASQYEAERTLGRVAAAFALLSLIVACLGLLGLSAYMAASRTKEIGIRKVVGATESRIVAMLSSAFLGLVAVAILIAWPVAYLTLHAWLSAFAFRVSVGPGPFLLSAIVVLVVSFATVSIQAVRAARANPVESLRWE